MLCNDARSSAARRTARLAAVGDPLEAALLIAARKHDRRSLRAAATWTGRRDPVRQRPQADDDAASLPASDWLVVVQGRTRGRARPAVRPGGAPTGRARRPRTSPADGFRVLAVADARTLAARRRTDSRAAWGCGGLAALTDPPQAGAAEVIARLPRAGIRTLLITGDHPATARAIADELGHQQRRPARSPTGRRGATGEHVARVERIAVFARTRPEQKVDIVRPGRHRGAVVAMTGDGVNDAPALRTADIGIAMGDRGTEVARQAADLVLTDDDLAHRRRRGRGGPPDLRQHPHASCGTALAGGLAEVLVILIGPFLGLLVPLHPARSSGST